MAGAKSCSIVFVEHLTTDSCDCQRSKRQQDRQCAQGWHSRQHSTSSPSFTAFPEATPCQFSPCLRTRPNRWKCRQGLAKSGSEKFASGADGPTQSWHPHEREVAYGEKCVLGLRTPLGGERLPNPLLGVDLG